MQGNSKITKHPYYTILLPKNQFIVQDKSTIARSQKKQTIIIPVVIPSPKYDNKKSTPLFILEPISIIIENMRDRAYLTKY